MTTQLSNDDAKVLVKHGYDSIAPAYSDWISKLPSPNTVWTEKLLAALAMASDVDVLELGCGNGLPCTAQLASKVRHVTANDISSTQIALAKGNLAVHPNITYLEGDMTKLEFEHSQFGAILAYYSLQHLPREEQPVMLDKMYSWLNKDGFLLCNFDPDEQPGTIMDDWLGVRMYYSSFGTEKSIQMMRDAGFEILEFETVSEVDGKKTVPFLWVLAKKSWLKLPFRNVPGLV